MITSSINAITDDGGTVASVTMAGTREGVDGFVELLAGAGLRVLKRVDVYTADQGAAEPLATPAPVEAASGPHGAGTGAMVSIEWGLPGVRLGDYGAALARAVSEARDDA